MPCAPVLLVAMLPLWIQATSAAAQLHFSEDWSQGKRAAVPPRPPSFAALLGALTSDGARSDYRARREGRDVAEKAEDDPCPLDETTLRLVLQAIMLEVEKVATCRIKNSQYAVALAA